MSEAKFIEVKLQIREPFVLGFKSLADYDQIVEEDHPGYFSTFVELMILNVTQGIADEKKDFAKKNAGILKAMDELMPKVPEVE